MLSVLSRMMKCVASIVFLQQINHIAGRKVETEERERGRGK